MRLTADVWPRVERRWRLAWPGRPTLDADAVAYWCDRLGDLEVEDVEAAVDALAEAPAEVRRPWPPSAPGELRGPAQDSARRREIARRDAVPRPAPVRDSELVSRERADVWQRIIASRLAGGLRTPPVAVLEARYPYAADPECEWLREIADAVERGDERVTARLAVPESRRGLRLVTEGGGR